MRESGTMKKLLQVFKKAENPSTKIAKESQNNIETLPSCFTAGASQLGLGSAVQTSNQGVLTAAESETLLANLAKSLWCIKIISEAFEIAHKKSNLEEKSSAKVFLDSIKDLLATPAILFKKNHLRKISDQEEKYEFINLPDEITVNSLRALIKNSYEKFINLVKENSNEEQLAIVEAMINDLRINLDNPKLDIYNLKGFFENAIHAPINELIRRLEKGEPIRYREELRPIAIERKIVMPATIGFELNEDFHLRLGESLIPILQTFARKNFQHTVEEFTQNPSIYTQTFSAMPTQEELAAEEKLADSREALDKELLEYRPIFYAFFKINQQLPNNIEEIKIFWKNQLVIYENEIKGYTKIRNREHHKIMELATNAAKNKFYDEEDAFDNEITFGKGIIKKYIPEFLEPKSAQIVSVSQKPRRSAIIGQRNTTPIAAKDNIEETKGETKNVPQITATVKEEKSETSQQWTRPRR